MADGDLYKPTGATTTVTGTQWQLSSDNGTTWTNTATAPNDTNHLFLNGISLTVNASLTFKTIRNTTSYWTGSTNQTVSNLTAGGKLIFTTTGVTLTASSSANVDSSNDGYTCLAGGSANALMDNTGAGTISVTFANIKIKAGTATTHHGFNLVVTGLTLNCTNSAFKGSASTAIAHGFNVSTTGLSYTINGGVDFVGGDFAGSHGISVAQGTTSTTINNTSGTQIRFIGGGGASSYGGNFPAVTTPTINIGNFTASLLNITVKAGAGSASYGFYCNFNTATGWNCNFSIPSASAVTTTLLEAVGSVPAVYSGGAPISIFRGTLKATTTIQAIVSLGRLNMYGNGAVAFEFPDPSDTGGDLISSWSTNATNTAVTEATIWAYATRELTSAKNITTDDAKINSTAIKTATDRIPTNPASIESTGGQIAGLS